jgi:hypothetical protein
VVEPAVAVEELPWLCTIGFGTGDEEFAAWSLPSPAEPDAVPLLRNARRHGYRLDRRASAWRSRRTCRWVIVVGLVFARVLSYFVTEVPKTIPAAIL